MFLASRSAAEALRRPNFGFTAPPSCSHRTSAWLTNRPGRAPVNTTAWTLGSRSTRSTNSSSSLAMSTPNKLWGPPSTRTIKVAPRSSIWRWLLSCCVIASCFRCDFVRSVEVL